MSGAREKVLARVRQALGRGPLDAAARAPLDERLAQPPLHTRIGFEQLPLERFIDKAVADAATVARVDSLEAVPEAVADYLKQHNLAARLALAPALADMHWPAHLEVEPGATRGAHETSVTPCFAAIAETGSVALLSSADSPTSLNLLPENHIVVVRRSQVVRHFEEVWQRVRDTDGGMPRALNLITGPSRTADIEQTIQLGAHGPRRVHLIVVED